MSKIKHAFPTAGHDAERYCGMTLRDYFAASALPSILGNAAFGPLTYQDIAEVAYRVADALIKERDKADALNVSAAP
jgi:hypothetical protein